jgi:cytochrome P450
MAIDFDPIAAQGRGDPYPLYRRLRDEAPVNRSAASGFYTVSRYEDVLAVLEHPERFSSRAMFTVMLNSGKEGFPPVSWDLVRFLLRFAFRARMNPLKVLAARNLIASDPPAHGGLRRLVNRGFTPRRIAELEPRIRVLVEELMAPLRQGAPFDLVGDLAIPLPVTVIAEMLGIEPARRRDFKRWSDAFVAGATGPGRSRPFAPAFADPMLELIAYFRSIVRQRRRAPGDDLVSAILAESPTGTLLSDMEAILFVQLLLIAGNETTTNLIGNAVQALLDHPEQLERVRRDPSRIPALVEEALRYDSPVQCVFRTATVDVEIAGVLVPAGATVAALLGSANRDERRFPEPDVFDVARDTHGHLGFGFGEHFCLGSALARLEARVALEALVPVLERSQPDSASRELVDSFLVRGPKKLTLRSAA